MCALKHAVLESGGLLIEVSDHTPCLVFVCGTASQQAPCFCPLLNVQNVQQSIGFSGKSSKEIVH